MKYFSSLMMVLSFLSACKQAEESDLFLSDIKDIKGKLITTDCLIGRPSGIVCSGTCLLFQDSYDGKALTILNTENGQCDRGLAIGNGPGEVAGGALRISVSNKGKQLNVFQVQAGRFNTYDLFEGQLALIESVNTKDRPTDVVATQERLVGIGPFEGGRYGIYTKQGDLIKEVGDYPFDGKDMNHLSRFFLYQGYLSSQPDGTHFVLGSSYSDNLEFYAIKGDEIQLLKKYGIRDVRATFNNNAIQLDGTCLLGYKGAYSTEKYCYMLYSGKTYEENMYRKMWATHIFVFDWNGSFVRSFRLDNEVASFCVDESNNTLYGIISHDGEGMIMKFEM